MFNDLKIGFIFKENIMLALMKKEDMVTVMILERICHHFLRKHRGKGFKDTIKNFIQNLQLLRCNMSPKLHYINSNWNNFPKTMGFCS